MAALPSLITVEEFRQMPDVGECAYELHHGEVVPVTRPKARHWRLQMRLVRLLDSRMKHFGEVGMEMPYRPFAEFDLRVADIAVVARARADAVDPEDNLHGAPDLVIEVKSPSNTRAQLKELVSLCLNCGAIQCWIVDPINKSVTVMHPDGTALAYTPGDTVPLDAFASGSLPVDEIFS